MTSSSEEDEFLRVALAAIPRITEMIAAFPAEHRAGALEVAKRRYVQAAQDFGCTTADSEVQWTWLCVSCKHKWSSKRFRRKIDKPTS